MRSIWKGHIRFSLVTSPVRIYNAVDTEETIRFNQLHKEDNGPVGYEKKCKKCNKTLAAEEMDDTAREALIARSPFATETKESPTGLLSGLRKLFGKK